MKFSEFSYERINLEEVKKEFEEIIKEFKECKTFDEQVKVHEKYTKLVNHFETMSNLVMIRHDGNTQDEFYLKEQEFFDDATPEVQALQNKYKIEMYNSEFKEEFKKYVGEVVFTNIELDKRSFSDDIIPLKQKENKLITEYNKLIAGAKIEFQGEVLNLSLLRKYLVDNDREIRKEAHKKETDFFLSIEEKLDDIFDKLVENRTEQAQILGFPNYTKLSYCRERRNCYDEGMVTTFRENVKKYIVPLAEKIHEDRRKRLGLEKLTFVDEEVFFKEGNPKPIKSAEEILKDGQKMYAMLSNETKEFFDFMIENELFDVFGRKNKQAGGYQAELIEYKCPFIFANFNGTSGDIDVITHECGHAFEAYTTREFPIREHGEITMETAEVHSMSMEFFTEPYMDMFFGDRSDEYIKMHLEDSIIFMPYGCMVDEFQHIVYNNPNLTKTQRKEEWLKLEKAYRPHMNYEDDMFFGKGGRWQKQLHIYNYPFYYIDYCIAMSCALQYKCMMEEDVKKAWETYYSFCKKGATDYFTNMIEQVGLENPFKEGTLKNIVERLSV